MSPHVKLSTGTFPCPRLASSRPFVHQIDLVLPATVDHHFTALTTTYATTECTLSELYEHPSRLTDPDPPFTALPIECNTDDTWCVDPRGVLTLLLSKTLYEQLGLVGTRLPFKGAPERYVVRVPLRRETTPVKMQARHRAALATWDQARAAHGRPRWHVACPASAREGYTTAHVAPATHRLAHVRIPQMGALVPGPGECPEAHGERVAALVEWVGMACLGAQRLCANDRVEPYVAVYDPPEPASLGDVMHVRWKGHMDAAFVQSVIDAATAGLVSDDKDSFASVTLHSSRTTPVSYLPTSSAKEAPLRVPGPDAENTVCVLLSNSTWAIVESIGKWDARWG